MHWRSIPMPCRPTSRLVTVLSGAEAVPEPLVAWWLARGATIQEGYGLTETAAQGCVLAHEDVRNNPGCAGKPLVHSRMKVVVDEKTEAAPDETGEIWIKGAVVTLGYWTGRKRQLLPSMTAGSAAATSVAATPTTTSISKTG